MNTFLIVENLTAGQTPKVDETFTKIINNFDLIVEIGFHRGVFSLWLNKNKNKNCKLFSYDITMENKIINNEEINFVLGDCFDPKIINEIKELIETNGKTLILCDGGHKNREFNLYSQYIKPGDVIMCHDFSENNEEYLNIRNKINWPYPSESDYNSIKDSVEKYNLSPYFYEDFKNVLWGCFIKNI